jgi:hypothetical protein
MTKKERKRSAKNGKKTQTFGQEWQENTNVRSKRRLFRSCGIALRAIHWILGLRNAWPRMTEKRKRGPRMTRKAG